MNLMKVIDESRNSQSHGKDDYVAQVVETVQNPEVDSFDSPRSDQSVDYRFVTETLTPLTGVNGFLGTALLTDEGRILGGEDISTVSFDHSSPWIRKALTVSREMCRESGFGDIDMLQFHTETGILFSICWSVGSRHFYALLITENNANIAMAALKLKQAAKALKHTVSS